MALVGGGGAGNIAGSNPAGAGTSLNYIGNHAYAYSGMLAFDNNATTLLRFTTGNEYVVATLNPMRTDSDSLDSQHRVTLDGQLVASFTMASGGTSAPEGPPVLLIPSYSTVLIEIINVSNTSGGTGGIAIMGEVYA